MFSRNSLRNSLRRSKFYCVEHSNSSTELFHYLLMLFWLHAQSVWVIDQTICMLNPQLVRLQQKEFAWPNKGFKQPICNRPQRLTHNTLTPQYPKHKSSTEILSFIILLWKLNKGLSVTELMRYGLWVKCSRTYLEVKTYTLNFASFERQEKNIVLSEMK